VSAAPQDPWDAAAAELAALTGGAPFELRSAAAEGAAAVRVRAPRGPVAARHAERPDVAAPWSAVARCGEAAAWLLAARAPDEPDRARAVLRRATDRAAALRLQALARQQAALTADLLEHLTHRLRTDVSSLQGVAEGALAHVFAAEEAGAVAAEVQAIGAEAQRRLSDVREVMAACEPGASRRPEPILERLRDELDAVGREAVAVTGPAGAAPGEQPLADVPGPGWAACARLLAEAVAGDPRLGAGRAEVAIAAHPGGWLVIAGDPAALGDPVPWTLQHLGRLAHAGQLVSIAGGHVEATRGAGGALRVAWIVPAAAPGPARPVQ
jgi:signal transduction histidine kinase